MIRVIQFFQLSTGIQTTAASQYEANSHPTNRTVNLTSVAYRNLLYNSLITGDFHSAVVMNSDVISFTPLFSVKICTSNAPSRFA